MDIQYDVIIIGAGPAGMTGAIYASRAGLKTMMLEVSAPGGKLIKTHMIENYPATAKEGGAELAYRMFEHSTNFGAEYVYGDVKKVVEHDGYKEVVTADNSYLTKSVIIASGTKERLLGLEGEDRLVGKGISYCAVCDGALYRGKDVVIIGGGNSALEESLFLTQFVNKVYIVIRRDVFRADKIIQDKVLQNDKIEIITKHVPHKIIASDRVEGIELENVDTKELTTLKIDAIFPYIGAIPNTDFVKDLNITNEQGYILVDNNMETAIKGIFAAGDCIDKTLRQVVTACSDGAIAGQKAYHYVNG
ncbi:MAG: thioredoxin-disulfide reductase [Erysipelotrichaceae bacterium]|nr:thioredoxin-disulfide reductase [Erysipelotrichaceae bacterium]MDY5252920.1 thioredoxin-disulfide reductase [Erysipelotrichaceae bacterium]